MDGDCRLSIFSLTEFAWAAGFFDGEGTTIAYNPDPPRPYLRLDLSIPQHGGAEVPAVLERFKRAALGLGYIVGPDDEGCYTWRNHGFEEAQATLALIWRFLGTEKRRQARVALAGVAHQYWTGLIRGRRGRRASRPHPTHAIGPPVAVAGDLEPAWAAGFLDAEGCFGVVRAQPRKGGAAWYRIRVSASQHGEIGVPPIALTRLQAVFAGLGRIERHGDPDDFRWLAEGPDAVNRVLATVGPWLGPIKLAQAELAIHRFAAQTRLKGSATHCIRGHPYGGVDTWRAAAPILSAV